MTTPIAPIEIDAEYNPKDIATASVSVCGYADSEAANRVGKKLIASAINQKVAASSDDSFADLSNKINQIIRSSNMKIPKGYSIILRTCPSNTSIISAEVIT